MRTAFLQEIRLAWRSLAREPGFSAPALLSLAAGVGVLTAIFSLLRLESAHPLRLSSALAPEYVRHAGWRAGWHGPVWSAGQLQADHFESMLHVLAVVAGLAFVIACSTVVILVLIRAATRTAELALRVAVGATRRRLLQRLLGEGLVMAGVGGLLGLVLGGLGAKLAWRSWPGGHVASHGGIGAWLALLAFLAPMVSVVPFALVAAAGVLRRSDLSGALVAGADGTAGRGELILQEVLAITQLAASVALVVASGLLLRNAAPRGAPGASEAGHGGALLYQIDFSAAGERDAVGLADAYGSVLDDVADVAGDRSVALATPGAWLGIGSLVFVTVQCGRCSLGGVYVPLMPGYVRLHAVSPGFFTNTGVRVLEGREFTPADRVGSPEVMLVNRSFAESHFEGGRPLGRKVQIGGIQDPWYTVVGIVGQVEGRGVGPAVRAAPVAYVPILQQPTLAADLAVSGQDDPYGIAEVVRTALDGTSEEASVSSASTMESYLERQVAPVRWLAVVFASVGGMVLLLGVFGAYTVMRFKVAQHQREIGLRRALGARKGRIIFLVILQSLGLALVGGALGAWSGLLLAGWLDTLVPGLTAFDLSVYSVAVVSLSVAALAGGSLSVRQATAVDPAVAIRAE